MLLDVSFENHGGDFASLGKNVPCVANSQFTAARYQQAFGVEPLIIPPLIDGKKKYGTETTRKNVTFINPISLKGLEVAMAIARECPDIPFSFVEGWYIWKDERRELKKKLAAVPNITLHPSVQDMRKVYSKCKILLAPSICEEAYGRVATEAQFSGIPVVASNRGGLPEAVGQGGVLLDPEGDIQEWVNTVRKLWNDEAYYAELSAAAQAHADRPALQWEVQSSLWEKIIEEASRHKQVP
jgi:glycosyltransferase involved in cell wall biosynthesis